jgi:hypothetical protein
MKLTVEQIDSRLNLETQSILDNEAEAAYWAHHIEDMNEYEEDYLP